MYSKSKINIRFVECHNTLMRWLKQNACDQLYNEVKEGRMSFDNILSIFERVDFDHFDSYDPFETKKPQGMYFDFVSFFFQFFEKRTLSEDEASSTIQYFAQKEMLQDVIRNEQFQNAVQQGHFSEKNFRELFSILKSQQNFDSVLEISQLCSFLTKDEVRRFADELKKKYMLRKMFKPRILRNLLSNNLMTISELHDIFMTIENSVVAKIDVLNIYDRQETVVFLVLSHILTLKELFDKSLEFNQSDQVLCNEVFNALMQNNAINQNDLKYIYNKLLKKQKELKRIHQIDQQLLTYEQNERLNEILNNKTSLMKKLFEESVVHAKNFNDFVQTLHNLSSLLGNAGLFIFLIEKQILTEKNYKTLLKSITSYNDIQKFVMNVPLLKHCLKNALIDIETLKKFTNIYETTFQKHNIDFSSKDSYSAFFETIYSVYDLNSKSHEKFRESCLKFDIVESEEQFQSIMQLSKAYHTLVLYESESNIKFVKEQKLKLLHTLTTSEQSLNLLNQIIKNNLTDYHTFEQLESLIVKDDAKKKVKLNL